MCGPHTSLCSSAASHPTYVPINSGVRPDRWSEKALPIRLKRIRRFMYLHIGDNFSIPMNSIITMIHAESGKYHRTGISHYDAEVIYILCPRIR